VAKASWRRLHRISPSLAVGGGENQDSCLIQCVLGPQESPTQAGLRSVQPYAVSEWLSTRPQVKSLEHVMIYVRVRVSDKVRISASVKVRVWVMFRVRARVRLAFMTTDLGTS